MIKSIWLVQPLAFARVGSSANPMQNFYWAENDLHPHGTGRTQIAAAETLAIGDDGAVRVEPATQTIVFKDGDKIRPVCPFFELHGEWDGGSGAITEAVLKANGKKPEDLSWHIDHCNLKAFHLTHATGDRIEASLDLKLGDFSIHTLEGRSPQVGEPLVPKDSFIPLGRVQLSRPTDEFPEFRLRFYAPAGNVFAPVGMQEKVAKILAAPAVQNPNALEALMAQFLGQNLGNGDWGGFEMPAGHEILNPKAQWPQYTLLKMSGLAPELGALLPQAAQVLAVSDPGDRSQLLRMIAGPTTDVGNLPPALFAYVTTQEAVLAGLGMVDDMGDGVISCKLEGVGTAKARIVVAPPVFAPDRRPPISLADGLADREQRSDVRDPAFFGGGASPMQSAEWKQTEHEIFDLLNRAFEAACLSNLDAWNDFFKQENAQQASAPGSTVSPADAVARLWTTSSLASIYALPLSQTGKQRHRRNIVREFMTALAADNPGLISQWIRVPTTAERLYDRRMPALMRGADRQPLHLTQRQFEELSGWARRLSQLNGN